jgi:uncharacterized coiled-coil DUF342 family protein
MKSLFFVVLLALITAGNIFAESPQKVTADAENFLTQQQERSASNHLFMEETAIVSHENRNKLNDYRSRFNNLNGRITVLKNQINVALKAREPDLNAISIHRKQLQGLIDEHDKLISEFNGWASTIK